MKIAALLLLFILGGCVKHNTPLIDSITVVYINPNDTKSEIDLSLILEDSIEIIPLESNDESYVSYIDKIEMMHGHIFVLDKKQNKLFSFDSKGKYVKCMGRQGNGPGEFVHIRDFTVVGDSIFIQDLYQEKCIVYDMNNNYICEFEDTPVYFEMLSLNNKFYLISNYWHLGSHNLFEYNLDNRKVVAAYLPFTEEVSKQKYSMVLGRQVSKYKDYALLNFTLLNDTIYKLDKEGIEPYFLIQFTERQMPENLQLANERHPMAEITKKKYLKGLKYIQNIENYFFGYYSDSGEIRYILYDKENGQVQVGKRYVMSQLGYMPFLSFYSTGDNTVIFKQESSELKNNWKNMEYYNHSIENKWRYNYLGQLMGQRAEDDNPILFKCHIK